MSGTNHGIGGTSGVWGGGSEEAQRDRIAGDGSVAAKHGVGTQAIVLAENFTCYAARTYGGGIGYGVDGGKHQERAEDPDGARE